MSQATVRVTAPRWVPPTRWDTVRYNVRKAVRWVLTRWLPETAAYVTIFYITITLLQRNV